MNVWDRMTFQILVLIMVISASFEVDEKCLDRHKCNSTDYQSYVICKRNRHKRSADCDSICDDCDCDSCSYKNCNGSCNSCCSSCCNNYMPCGTSNCCHKTCRDECKLSGSDCRRKCGRNCNAEIKIISERNESVIAKNENNVNVTTIINLNNLINNTNHIDIPMQINNTNVNNITLLTANGSEQSNCCIVLSPRQCEPIKESPYVRCFHFRSKQCGNFCTATIVHKEERQICQSAYPGVAPNCYPKIVYIPQPHPRCKYESTWPYVSCGIRKSTSCAGCYTNERTKSYMSCPSECYDVGFGTNPYYRRGPFYRQTYLEDGFGAYGYGGYSAYGGGFLPPPHSEFPFENIPSGGFGPATGRFEPNLTSILGNWDLDSISVGPMPPGYDYLRNSREVEVDVNQKPKNASVHSKPIKIDNNDIEVLVYKNKA